MAKLFELVEKNAAVVVLLAVVLTLASGFYAVSNLGINTSTTDMISPEVPFRVNNLAYNEAFPETKDVILVVVDGPSPEAADHAADRLAAELANREAVVRDVYVPTAEPYFQENAFLLLPIDDLQSLSNRLADVAPILGSLSKSPNLAGFADMLALAQENEELAPTNELVAVLDKLTEVADAQAAGQPHDLSWQSLLSGGVEAGGADQSRRFVLVQPVLDYEKLKPARDTISLIRKTAAELDLTESEGFAVRLTGQPAINQDELDRVQLAGTRSGLITLGMILILLLVGLTSWRLVLATVGMLLIGLSWTAGFAAFAVGHLNLISVAFAVLFVGLGVDFAIHYCLRYREEVATSGAFEHALGRTARGVTGALALTTIAAAAGFYSFIPTDYLGLAELGIISGTGMFISLVTSLTVLPAMLVLLRPAQPWQPRRRMAALLTPTLGFGRPILGLTGMLGLAGLFFVPQINFDANPLNLRDPSDESVATFLDLAKEPRTTPYTINVLVDTEDEEKALKQKLKTLPTVDRVVGLQSFVPNDQDEKFFIIDEMALFLDPAFRDRQAKVDLSPSERRGGFGSIINTLSGFSEKDAELSGAASRLREKLSSLGSGDKEIQEFEQRVMRYFPKALTRLETALATDGVSADALPAALTDRWISSATGQRRVEIYAAGGISETEELEKFAREVLGVAPTASGAPVTIAEAGATIVGAFAQASSIAFVVIIIILLLTLRSIIDTVFVLIPLLIAGILTAATAVILSVPINFANIIVLPLLLGLGVSSGIHFVLRRRQVDAESGLLSSSTPRAVFFSALTTIASFGSLALSGHQGMTSMGQLLTISISYTLLATIVILPALMSLTSKNRDETSR